MEDLKTRSSAQQEERVLGEGFAIAAVALSVCGERGATMAQLTYRMRNLNLSGIKSVKTPIIKRDALGYYCEDIDVHLTNFISSRRSSEGVWTLTDEGKMECAKTISYALVHNPEAAKAVLNQLDIDALSLLAKLSVELMKDNNKILARMHRKDMKESDEPQPTAEEALQKSSPVKNAGTGTS